MSDELSTEDIYAEAEKATHALVKERGADARFPFDAIWPYASLDVPSRRRPSAQRHLTAKGLIVRTGMTTPAESANRAGSPTNEYRPGPVFAPESELTSTAPNASRIALLLHRAAECLEAQGFLLSAADLANFYVILKVSPLVILAGPTGTGKSLLPRLFANLVAGEFRFISVKPQWGDNADLMGYTPSLTPDSFVEGEFTRALRSGGSSQLNMILLDEMNIATVEHYFSDFLSVVATRHRAAGEVVTDPLPLELPAPPAKGPDPYKAFRGLTLPSNVRVIGTANLDESTRQFSPKVLDRAFTIELVDINLGWFADPNKPQPSRAGLEALAAAILNPENPASVGEGYASERDLFDAAGGMLEEIREILEPARVSLAYRTRDAILLYLWHWKRDDLGSLIPLSDALDRCIMQKVIPRISGTGDAMGDALKNLQEWLMAKHEFINGEVGPFSRSADRVARLGRQLSDEGAANALAL